jgi:hypothetical protein
MAARRHPGEQLGELSGVRADVDDHGVGGDVGREQGAQRRMVLLRRRLEQMRDP